MRRPLTKYTDCVYLQATKLLQLFSEDMEEWKKELNNQFAEKNHVVEAPSLVEKDRGENCLKDILNAIIYRNTMEVSRYKCVQ